MPGTQTTHNPVHEVASPPSAPPIGNVPYVPPIAPGMVGMPASEPAVIYGPNGEQARILSEAEIVAEINKESHALHIGVLGIGLLASVLLASVEVGGDPGLASVVAAGFGVVIAIALTTPVNSVAAFLVGKMFAHDFGSFPLLLLRVGAVTAMYTAAMTGAAIVVGPMFSLLLGLPVMLLLAVWLIDMDILQAMIFSIVLSSVKWLIGAFIMASFAATIPFSGSMDSNMQLWDESGEYSEYDEYEMYDGYGYEDDAEYAEDW